ncbi:Vegetative cell wall protein gp1 OS=Streptomyces glaucescens OX=1907 GN=SGLAU_01515 PE=4 SV=1 [Streptomyces glaucescens]
MAAVPTGLVAWRRGRRAVTVHAELVESTVDVYLRRLVEELGVDASGSPPDPRVGTALNRAALKAR